MQATHSSAQQVESVSANKGTVLFFLKDERSSFCCRLVILAGGAWGGDGGRQPKEALSKPC